MNKLRMGLIGFLTTSFILFPGCRGSKPYSPRFTPRYTSEQISQTDISESRYKSQMKGRADKLAKSNYFPNKEAAIELYGELGHLEEMDKLINEIIQDTSQKNLSVFKWAAIGQKYHQREKIKEIKSEK